MSSLGAQATLSYHSLIAPLMRNPTTDLDKMVNEMRIKYRTYDVEFNINRGYAVLPTTFGDDFGDELHTFAKLIDKRDNEFEVLVERRYGLIFLTKGWHAMLDFYGIALGALVTMVYVGNSRFGIKLRDKFGVHVRCPRFTIPIKFEVDKAVIANNFMPLPFTHEAGDFEFCHEKLLDYDEVETGWLVLDNVDFCKATMDMRTKNVRMVDECGNLWKCTVMFENDPCPHFKIGGGWKRMAVARRFRQGIRVVIGAPHAGNNDTLYFKIIRS